MKNQASKTVLKTLMAVALVSTFGSAFAQADLGDVMTQMQKDVSGIKAQINTPAQNASSAALADDFATVAATAKAQSPAAVQGDAKTQFDAMIDKCVDLGTQLGAALRAGNTAQANDLLNQLMALKAQGHAAFRN